MHSVFNLSTCSQFSFFSHLISAEGFTKEEITAAGLTVDPSAYTGIYGQERQTGNTRDAWRSLPYDRFRGRIMVPIKNENGVIIGFGGRVLDDENENNDFDFEAELEPDFQNSPENVLLNAQPSYLRKTPFRVTRTLVHKPENGIKPVKYLNSPESVVFKKGSVLFGLDLAKKKIARSVFTTC